MADFEDLKVYDGVGPYHLNRFRIAFERPAALSKEDLARRFVGNFPTYLNSPAATVEFKAGTTFRGKPTLKFWGSLKLLGLVEANFDVHHDWVVQEWVDPTIGFTAQTLKREFFDAIDDLAAGAGGTVGEVLTPIPIPFAGGMYAAVEINRLHFLAGRRSWRLDAAAAFGQTPADFAYGGSGDLLILETVAVERFSSAAFVVGDFVLALEQRIPPVWINLLENWVRISGLSAVNTLSPTPGGIWKRSGNVVYHVNNFPDLSGLRSNIQFVDMYPLYRTILP